MNPAVEYGSGTEYWTHGKPHGFPAVSQNYDFYEEDWYDGHIIVIREEVDVSIE